MDGIGELFSLLFFPHPLIFAIVVFLKTCWKCKNEVRAFLEYFQLSIPSIISFSSLVNLVLFYTKEPPGICFGRYTIR